MNRPQIIVNMFSSIDGRISTGPGRDVSEWTSRGHDGGAHRECHLLFDELDCDGIISGSETLLVWGKQQIQLEDPIPQPKKSRVYIVFDGRGRINWAYTDGLLVVTKEDVSDAYIDQLNDKQIDFIQAGRGDHIDLSLALERLYEKGFRRLGLSGGGRMNGAFLRKELVDEISVIIAPVVIGGNVTPTLFDCLDLKSVEGIQGLQLIESKALEEGSVWLYYKTEVDKSC